MLIDYCDVDCDDKEVKLVEEVWRNIFDAWTSFPEKTVGVWNFEFYKMTVKIINFFKISKLYFKLIKFEFF